MAGENRGGGAGAGAGAGARENEAGPGLLATLSVEGAVARLTLNRPGSRNALSIGLLEALHARVDELERAPGVTAVVVSGEGPSFCAGMDLKEVIIDAAAGGSGDPGLPLRLLSSLARLGVRLRRLGAVTVASVNGAAVGGGCGLACVCDIAVSHADARLGFPEVDLGICPAVVAPALVRKIGAGRARAVLLMGGVMTGAEAHAAGIVDHLAADRAGLGPLTEGIVQRLAKAGPRALAATKGLLNELDGSLDEATVLRGAELSARVLATAEAQSRLIARRS